MANCAAKRMKPFRDSIDASALAHEAVLSIDLECLRLQG